MSLYLVCPSEISFVELEIHFGDAGIDLGTDAGLVVLQHNLKIYTCNVDVLTLYMC